MTDEVVRAAPVALLVALAASVLGGLLLYRLRGRSLVAAMATLALIPLAATLAGVAAVSGFMYTPEFGGTVAVVAVVVVVTVPAALLLGRAFAREALWQREARDAERQSEKARRDLVSGMSHDLRAPLAGILGMTDALSDGVVHRPDEVAEYLARIRWDTVRMASMVEELFQLSRATSAGLRLDLAPTALAEVVSDAVAVESPAAEHGEVALVAASPESWPTVRASDTDLTRVVRNVLANAVRHTPAGATVHLSAGTAEGRGWLDVQDACGGIPDDDIGRVFDVGFRGTAARTPHPDSGAGLGLAIARALVEAHGGHIGVVNAGPGCRVRVTLPLADRVTPADQDGPGRGGPAGRRAPRRPGTGSR